MIFVIDTETTGIGKLDQVVQLATIRVPDNIAVLKSSFVSAKPFGCAGVRKQSPYFPSLVVTNSYFNPSVPINKHAQAVHGLSKIQLCKYPSTKECGLSSSTRIVVGHNVSFDTRMLHVELPSICTMNLAKKIEKIRGAKFGFENYKLTTIFSFYYPELVKQFESEVHDALGDCEMCLLVLIKLLEQFPFLATLTDVQQYFFPVAE